MTQNRALERWEKIPIFEVTPKSTWSIAKSRTKRDGLKAPSIIHGPLGRIFYLIDKANVITDCLENQFKTHDLCGHDHKRHVESGVHALLAAVDEDTPVKERPMVLMEFQTDVPNTFQDDFFFI
jgi:hypothetical protein